MNTNENRVTHSCPFSRKAGIRAPVIVRRRRWSVDGEGGTESYNQYIGLRQLILILAGRCQSIRGLTCFAQPHIFDPAMKFRAGHQKLPGRSVAATLRWTTSFPWRPWRRLRRRRRRPSVKRASAVCRRKNQANQSRYQRYCWTQSSSPEEAEPF